MKPHRRRSRDLFPTDGPVSADRLIGRADDVDELANSLDNGIHRVLAGPRRTGKTSVALAALAELRHRDVYTVSLDLFRLAGPADLAEALVAGLLENRPAARRLAGAAVRTGRSAASAARTALSVSLVAELGEDVQIALTPGLAASDPQRYLRSALELCQRVADTDGRRVVLFFDEFQDIAGARSPFGDPDVLTRQMRAIWQDSPDVTVLFAGSVEHLMRDLFTPVHRAFYRFGSFADLSVIDAAQWRDGIRERLAEDHRTIEPAALDALVARGGLHPRTTMLLAQHAHNLAVLLDRERVDGELTDEAYTASLAADWVSHQSELERIRGLGKHTFEVARRVARGEPPYAGGERKSVQRALDALERAGLVERSVAAGARHGTWHLVDPLLRDYLAALHAGR